MKPLQATLLSLMLLLTLPGCTENRADDVAPLVQQQPTYRFESHPQLLAAGGQPVTARDPKLALRASGALYMLGVYQQQGKSRLGLFVSHDGGDLFAPPVPVSPPGASASSHGENSPSLAFGGTAIYALWEKRTLQGSQLLFSRSLTFGRSFEKPVSVTDKPEPSTNAFSTLAVAPDGDIYAAWLDGRDGIRRGTTSLYLARSSDRGASFGPNVRVAQGVCPCCRPSLGFNSRGELLLSWRHVFQGQVRDMALAVSQDDGRTFSMPVRVAEDNWSIEGCPHSGAAMAMLGERLYLAWFSAGSNLPQPGIRLAFSDDGGRTFSRPMEVSGPVLDANHPVLAGAGERLVLAFQGRHPEEQDGWAPLSPYLVEIGPDGEVSPPLAVAGSGGSISYPAAVADEQGRVFLSWTEHGRQGPQIVLSRGRRSRASPF